MSTSPTHPPRLPQSQSAWISLQSQKPEQVEAAAVARHTPLSPAPPQNSPNSPDCCEESLPVLRGIEQCGASQGPCPCTRPEHPGLSFLENPEGYTPFLSHSTELFCALGSASTTSPRDRASITISYLDSSKHCPRDFLVPSLAPFRPFSSGCQSELEERVTCPSECSTSCSRRTAPHAFLRATRDPFLSAPAWHPLPAFSLLFRGCHPAGRQKDSLEPGGQQTEETESYCGISD
nr:uncharacterized protein LOC129022577 [Pongo pygmaeus]